MRFKHTRTLLGILLPVLFFSCSDEDSGSPEKGQVKVNLQAGMGNGVTTRAYDAQWEASDAIGIAMLDNSRTTFINGIFNNRYYTPSGNESFTPASADQTIYFPQDGSQVYFKGYYPYRSDLTSNMTFPVDLSDQSSLPAIDVMTSEHLAGFSKSDPNVHLRMHHRLTKVTFKFIRGEGLEELPLFNSAVTIHGMKTTGTCDILEDTVLIDDNINDISLPDRGIETERTGIVMPRPAGQGVTFDFNFTDGSNFTAAMSDTLQLLSGYKYTFYITLEKTSVSLWVDIQDWVDTEPSYFEIINATYPFANENVNDGDKMAVYLKGAGDSYSFFDSLRYQLSDDSWYSLTNSPNLSWEDAVPFEQSSTFRASMRYADVKGTNQMPDILVSDEVTVDRYHGVGLTFTHAGSRIVVRLQSSTFTDAELASADIVLPQYMIGGSELNGEFIPGTARGDVQVNKDNPADKFAIVQPQTVDADDDMVKVTINGETYTATRNTAYVFEKGKSYLLDVTLNKTQVSLGVRVIPWVAGGQVDLTVDPIQVTGTLEETDDFFVGKSIQVYKFGSNFEEAQYNCTLAGGDKVWNGPVIYWDDNLAALPITMSGAYYGDPSLIPSGISNTNTTFPWNLPQNQNAGYNQYDLLMDSKTFSSPQMVNFNFQHVLSKVKVVLKSAMNGSVPEFSDADLQGATITLNNFVLNGNASLPNSNVVPTGAKTTLTPMLNAPDSSDPDSPSPIYTALVIPQTISAETSVISVQLVGFPASTFNGSIQSDLLFEAGKVTKIVLTLEKTKINLSATLEPWTDGDEGQVIIQ